MVISWGFFSCNLGFDTGCFILVAELMSCLMKFASGGTLWRGLHEESTSVWSHQREGSAGSRPKLLCMKINCEESLEVQAMGNQETGPPGGTRMSRFQRTCPVYGANPSRKWPTMVKGAVFRKWWSDPEEALPACAEASNNSPTRWAPTIKKWSL